MLDMKKFYGWASLLMGISFFGNVWNIAILWDGLTMGAKIAQIAGSVLFNLLLFILFWGLWKVTPSSTSTAKTIESPDLDAIIKKFQSEEIAQNKSSMQTPSKSKREIPEKMEDVLH